MMKEPLKVIFVDDHPIVRTGMVQVVAEDPELKVVAQAGTAEEALELLTHTEVDVAVVDFDLPGMNGLTLASNLLSRTPAIPVVILTLHNDEQIFNEALDRGVGVYLLKDEAVASIPSGIKSAAVHEFYVSPTLAGHTVRRSRRTSEFARSSSGLETLTPTERAVLMHVAENKSSREIAAEMGVSYRTVTTHRNHISHKLALTGNQPLLNFALANKSAIFSLLKE